jgi:hypothetical protein
MNKSAERREQKRKAIDTSAVWLRACPAHASSLYFGTNPPTLAAGPDQTATATHPQHEIHHSLHLLLLLTMELPRTQRRRRPAALVAKLRTRPGGGRLLVLAAEALAGAGAERPVHALPQLLQLPAMQREMHMQTRNYQRLETTNQLQSYGPIQSNPPADTTDAQAPSQAQSLTAWRPCCRHRGRRR